MELAMTPRTMFPTLADTPRDQWPPSVRVHPAPPGIEGAVETVECGCRRTVPASDMVDLREIDHGAHGLPGGPILCQSCFHGHARHGRITHSEIARTLHMHPDVIASLESADSESLGHGWHMTTDRNRHLHPDKAKR